MNEKIIIFPVNEAALDDMRQIFSKAPHNLERPMNEPMTQEATIHETAKKIVSTLQTEMKDTSLGYALQHNPDLPGKAIAVVEKVLKGDEQK
ncbi:MAG TPA: hypothetical protein V6C76_11535 [Drouetiella sp.]